MRTRNSGLSIIIVSVCAAIFLVMSIIGGIHDLTARTAPVETAVDGEVIEYDAFYALEVWVISHKLFGIIPTRQEYFYLTVSEDGAEQYLVMASKSWFEDNFGSDGYARGDDVHISAILRRVVSKNGLHTGEINDWLSESGVSINEYLYADSNYKTSGVLKLVTAALILVIAALIITIIRFHALQMLSGAGGKAAIAGLVVSFLALAVIMVWFI